MGSAIFYSKLIYINYLMLVEFICTCVYLYITTTTIDNTFI